ncbi:helix-turn-helix transcriptional regulator [Actinobacteria bacterium YIM 96077]|uniref:Helix-turn-helix transcriptional regulator n=1 Tax=Phytoactinopolyspora halophila TaxID=1981511 RepID=A0A329QSI6_9ACTN|nr:LuxR C-terminal-related transcriptional regulator [Phytoactinopolyspora halophila]AYY14902.1 helix-turn-helix transcriptional regulator [Actinobacteria bacterium YIM 96077]RAW15360.1 helix-turn-helix transcriptional regulator [Phytoactinopolyspora halophila]
MESHTLTPREQLDRLVTDLPQQAGIHAAFAGFVTTPGDSLIIESLSGTDLAPLANLRVDAGAGLGGKALTLGKPASVSDYERAGGITHHYDRQVIAARLRSMVAIPVSLDGRPHAMVYGALRTPVPFSDVRLSILRRAARSYELDLRVATEVERRLAELDPSGSLVQMRQELRDLRAEVRSLAGRVADPDLRARLERLGERTAAGEGDREGPVPALRPRELETIEQVAAGSSNADVARRLGIETSTVKAYLKSAMRKMGVHNRVALVVTCRRHGLIP